MRRTRKLGKPSLDAGPIPWLTYTIIVARIANGGSVFNRLYARVLRRDNRKCGRADGAFSVVGSRAAALLLGLTLAAMVTDARAHDWNNVSGPTQTPPQAIGGYTKGCLAGAKALPADGPGYQVIRLSRDRFYGHPRLIDYIETLAKAARTQGWSGLMVGDIAQPRGGPMPSGHRSHQIGLDADIWFLPAPSHRLSPSEREAVSAVSVVNNDGQSVDRQRWTDVHVRLLKTAASFPDVERIFVNPAIKRELCRVAKGDRAWLAKIRPWWGHNYHFHVRLRCPTDNPGCRSQDPVPAGDSCDESLEWWFSDKDRARLDKPKIPRKPPKPLTLADLPHACRGVLNGL